MCVTVCVPVCVRTASSSTYEAKKQVTVFSQTGLVTCAPPPRQLQKLFLTKNAMSKKPLQANGQTWVAISC